MREVTFTAEEVTRLMRLGCQVIHRNGSAREAGQLGNLPQAYAEYYAADCELLSRMFAIMPEDIRTEMLAQNESNPPGK